MTLAEDSERLIIGTITPLHMSTASPSPPTMYREHTHMYREHSMLSVYDDSWLNAACVWIPESGDRKMVLP